MSTPDPGLKEPPEIIDLTDSPPSISTQSFPAPPPLSQYRDRSPRPYAQPPNYAGSRTYSAAYVPGIQPLHIDYLSQPNSTRGVGTSTSAGLNSFPPAYTHETINKSSKATQSSQQPRAANASQRPAGVGQQKAQAVEPNRKRQKKQDNTGLQDVAAQDGRPQQQLQQSQHESARLRFELQQYRGEVAQANAEVARMKEESNRTNRDLQTSQVRNNGLQQELSSSEDRARDYQKKYEASQSYCLELEKEREDLKISKEIESMPDTAVKGGSSDNPNAAVTGESRNVTHDARISVSVIRISNDGEARKVGSPSFKMANLRTRSRLFSELDGWASKHRKRMKMEEPCKNLVVAGNPLSEQPSRWMRANAYPYDQWLSAVQAVCSSHRVMGAWTEWKRVKPHDDEHIHGYAAVFYAAKGKSAELTNAIDAFLRGTLQIQE